MKVTSLVHTSVHVGYKTYRQLTRMHPSVFRSNTPRVAFTMLPHILLYLNNLISLDVRFYVTRTTSSISILLVVNLLSTRSPFLACNDVVFLYDCILAFWDSIPKTITNPPCRMPTSHDGHSSFYGR